MRMLVMAATAAGLFCAATQAIGQPSSGTMQGNVPEPSTTATAPAPPNDTAGYLREAGRSDLYEIQAGHLAASRAHSQQVKDFANRMIHDHTESTDKLLTAAQAAGTPAAKPTSLDPRRESMMAQLRSAPSPDFDRIYLHQQLMAHDEALHLHQNYEKNGQTPTLRPVAGQISQVVQQHITMLGQLGAR
jgi:putative membrane protein